MVSNIIWPSLSTHLFILVSFHIIYHYILFISFDTFVSSRHALDLTLPSLPVLFERSSSLKFISKLLAHPQSIHFSPTSYDVRLLFEHSLPKLHSVTYCTIVYLSFESYRLFISWSSYSVFYIEFFILSRLFKVFPRYQNRILVTSVKSLSPHRTIYKPIYSTEIDIFYSYLSSPILTSVPLINSVNTSLDPFLGPPDLIPSPSPLSLFTYSSCPQSWLFRLSRTYDKTTWHSSLLL